MSTIRRDGTTCDLVYSPDDGGWYLERHDDGRTSQVFDSEQAARTEPITWE